MSIAIAEIQPEIDNLRQLVSCLISTAGNKPVLSGLYSANTMLKRVDNKLARVTAPVLTPGPPAALPTVEELLKLIRYADPADSTLTARMNLITRMLTLDDIKTSGIDLLDEAAAYQRNDVIRILIGRGFRSDIVVTTALVHADPDIIRLLVDGRCKVSKHNYNYTRHHYCDSSVRHIIKDKLEENSWFTEPADF